MGKDLFLLDAGVIKNILEDQPESRKFLEALEAAKKKGGVFITTPSQLLSALSTAKYLEFDAGNMQRLLNVLEINLLVPKEHASKIINITYDNKKGLVDEMILFAKATQGVIK